MHGLSIDRFITDNHHRFGTAVGPDDTYLSFLPYAHVFEQLNCCSALMAGARIGCYAGEPLKLLDDMQLLKPTVRSLQKSSDDS